MPQTEGVIKFRLDYTPAPLPIGLDDGTIAHWFGVCRELDLVGRDPTRYQGYAYGNISRRLARGFLITGTQTGGLPRLQEEQLSQVLACDSAGNRIEATGPIRPSSEAMTHDQVYQLSERVGFVIHVHSAVVWRQASRLGLPVTDPAIEYGTPAMAHAVRSLYPGPELELPAAFAMGGHEDGVVVFGADADSTGQHLLQLYRQALALLDEPGAGQ